MANNLVSVIITTYCREPFFIKRAIDSVLNQTYKNFELIIVDDSPSDYINRNEVKNLIDSYEFPILFIQHERNMGASFARNTGIKYSKGEFIAFLDDDDEWLPKKIEKQIKLMKDKMVGLVSCREYVIDLKNNTKIENERKYKEGWVFNDLITDNFLGGNSFVLIRKKVFEKCGYFSNIKSAQDMELFLRISKKYKIKYVNEPLLNYYINHGERITLNPYNKINGYEYINSKYKIYLFFHPLKKRERLRISTNYYKITKNTKKYIFNIISLILITPWKLKENYYLLIRLNNYLKGLNNDR